MENKPAKQLRKRFAWALSLILSVVLSFPASAHVGSSGVVVQKQAGSYQLLIRVQPPDVVPGTARVTVYVEQGRAKSLGARPIYFQSGDAGAPTFDVLLPVGQNRYEGDLWLMESGSSSIELMIDGPDGRQQVIVPVVAVATALRDMPPGTGWGLAAMGLLLVVMLVTIIGASNADGVVVPGQEVPEQVRRRRLVGMGVGLVFVTLILTGWRSWWNSTAEEYRDVQLYRPAPITTSVKTNGAQRQLTIQFDTTGFGTRQQSRRLYSFLVPDHGKLMHAFLVRMNSQDAFAHLHPVRRDTLHFVSSLPPLPAGKYLLFADVVYRSGFTETLTDTLELPSPKTVAQPAGANPGPPGLTWANPADRDDSWLISSPVGAHADAMTVPRLDNDMAVCGKPGASMRLADGSTMFWMDKPAQPLEVGKLYSLKFAVADAQGKPASLEPYLGMQGHAAVLRSDGSVYIHLHPIGTFSMAAEKSLTGRIADTARTFQYPRAADFSDSIDAYVNRLKTLPEVEKNALLATGMNHQMKSNNMVEFPYAFPRAGRYRIWVQVQRNGQVLTGVFDTEVKEPLF